MPSNQPNINSAGESHRHGFNPSHHSTYAESHMDFDNHLFSPLAPLDSSVHDATMDPFLEQSRFDNMTNLSEFQQVDWSFNSPVPNLNVSNNAGENDTPMPMPPSRDQSTASMTSSTQDQIRNIAQAATQMLPATPTAFPIRHSASEGISPTNTTRISRQHLQAHDNNSPLPSSRPENNVDPTAQQAILDLIEEICLEAARRKWYAEASSRLYLSIGPAPPLRNFHWHPYNNTPTRPRPAASHERSSSMMMATEPRPARLIEYISSITDSVWRGARGRIRDRHRAENEAALRMAELYTLGAGVVGAVEAAGEGAVFGLAEVRRVVDLAGRFSRILGFEEGGEVCLGLVAWLRVWGAGGGDVGADADEMGEGEVI